MTLAISVDASLSWSIGLHFGDHWNMWRWTLLDWKTHGHDISWAEMIVVKLAARCMEYESVRNSDVLILSDNQGMVGGLQLWSFLQLPN